MLDMTKRETKEMKTPVNSLLFQTSEQEFPIIEGVKRPPSNFPQNTND
jgi:hypothetical protein